MDRKNVFYPFWPANCSFCILKSTEKHRTSNLGERVFFSSYEISKLHIEQEKHYSKAVHIYIDMQKSQFHFLKNMTSQPHRCHNLHSVSVIYPQDETIWAFFLSSMSLVWFMWAGRTHYNLNHICTCSVCRLCLIYNDASSFRKFYQRLR